MTPAYTSPARELSNLNVIESAKRTLTFYPITQADLAKTKANLSEDATTAIILEIALRKFLEVNMSIPYPINQGLDISNIECLHQDEPEKITVRFSDIRHVKTIFRFVKNLAPGQKVSITIPPVLSAKYDELQTHAYHLRNGNIRHKTVIKYLGNSIALYAKSPNSSI